MDGVREFFFFFFLYCVYRHQTCPLRRHHGSIFFNFFFLNPETAPRPLCKAFHHQSNCGNPPPPPPSNPAATQRANFCPSTGFLVVATSIDVVRLMPLRYRFDSVVLIPVLPSLFVFALLQTFCCCFSQFCSARGHRFAEKEKKRNLFQERDAQIKDVDNTD